MENTGTGPLAETVDTSRHRALGSASRVGILNLVRRASAGLTAGEVAAGTGLHLTTAREHLERLTAAGLLHREREPDGTPGRPAWRYHAVPADPSAAAAPQSAYRDFAGALVAHLAATAPDPGAAGAAAGTAWGRELAAGLPPSRREAPVDGVVAVLDRVGFAPRVVQEGASGAGDGAAVLHLNACPFLDLATGNPQVVCGLHEGVVRGALEQLGAGGTGMVLEPFGAPTGCVLRLGRRHGRTGAGARRPARRP